MKTPEKNSNDVRIEFVPARKDNYCYLIHRRDSHLTAVVDPSDAAPVLKALDRLGLKLELILNTHHHPDHVGGNLELVEKTNSQVYSSAYDQVRVPGATRGLSDGEKFRFDGLDFQIALIPGHTQGQIAFYIASAGALFVGDTLFAMGCGRLFEGTAAQMWASLHRIKSYPPSTRLYFGHEYTARNGAFALQNEPENLAAILKRIESTREAISHQGWAPAPTLSEEVEVNPFLRAPNVDTFTRLRSARDVY